MRYLSWLKKHSTDLNGKIIIITGANSGTGFEAARYLSYLHAKVIMACRNQEKAIEAKAKIICENPNAQLEIINYDQSSFVSIDKFIETLKSRNILADVLIANAGIYHPKSKQITKEGFPLTVGTNYLGMFYLLKHAADFLKNDARIIFVSSLVYRRIRLLRNYDFLTKENESMIKQYAKSKYAMNSLFYYMNANTGYKCLLMHPGVSNTNIVGSTSNSYARWLKGLARLFMPIFSHRPDKASLGIVALAAKAEIKSGTYLIPRGLFHIVGKPKMGKLKRINELNSARLYQVTHELVENIKENVNVRST